MRLTYQKLSADLAAVDTALSDSSPNNLILESGEIKAPHQLEKLTRSDEGYLKGTLKLSVVIEVWDVYKRERIFIKSYMSENFYNPFFHPMYRLLELDIVERSIFKSVSESIALKLTSDLAHVL